MTEVAPAENAGPRWLLWGIAAVAVAMSLFHIYAIAWEPPAARMYRAIHLIFAMGLVFLLYPLFREGGKGRLRIWDAAVLVLSLVVCSYVIVVRDYLDDRVPYVDDLTKLDIVMATLAVVLVLEGARRILGWALPLTALAFIAYAFLFTRTKGVDFLDQNFMTLEGIYGPTLYVSAGYVVVFVLFGSFMERCGTGQLFMDFALALTGHTAGGPGKVSVISSSLFGTISGSAVANVMVDGPITIPLMKRTGFKPHFAAAIEAVASTGGQIMPPIMGAAAFVMAEFLQVGYLQVVIWALVPSLLYYIACFAAVHFYAKREGLHGVPRAQCPRLFVVLGERGYLFLPILMILAVMFAGHSAPYAALAGIAACLPFMMLRGWLTAVPFALGFATYLVDLPFRIEWHGIVVGLEQYSVSAAAIVATVASFVIPLLDREARQSFPARVKNVGAALIDGAKNSLSVAMACAAAGIVIGTITLTGVAQDFTQFLVSFSHDALWLALLVTAAAGIILGMGMPTTPAYILMTALLVPAIMKLGVIQPAAHMFAFYFAILSAITPPVALAVFAAASLAKSDLWATGWAAVRIGAAGFIVPFMFAYEPSLLMIGAWYDVALASLSATVGCIVLAAGLYGYLLRPCLWWERAVLIAAALLLIKPGWVSDLIGLALIAAIVVYQAIERRRAAAVETPAVAR